MKYIVLLGFCFLSYYSSAQEQLPFQKVKEFYIQGDAQAIGNSILGMDATQAFNDLRQINDELKMEYVDIDASAATFSSSSAFLEVPENGKIVYAGLYWSGTYGYEKSVKRQQGDKFVFKGKGERDEDFERIKFKMPEGTYQDLEGTVLYDGSLSTVHESNVPYVCYTEVTDLLNESPTINGSYTVANVKATEGYISGGSCAGWMLYVVYETPDVQPKYITTYQGFEYVNKNRLEIEFKNFKAVTEGLVKTSITLASLEGDSRLYRDQCAIWIPEKRSYIPLENELRKKHNFFNSTISRNGVVNTNRNPPSINTLGFDIAEMKIDNTDNALIANGTSELKFRYTTKADRYYLFFTAFETEIDNEYYTTLHTPEAVTQEDIVVVEEVQVPLVLEKTGESVKIEESVQETEVPEPPINTVSTNVQSDLEEKPVIIDERIQKLQNKKTTYLEGIAPGYYLVTNVFSQSKLATDWKVFLEERNHRTKILQNPENGWFYVYITSSPDATELIGQLQEASKKTYLEDLWVFKINIE